MTQQATPSRGGENFLGEAALFDVAKFLLHSWRALAIWALVGATISLIISSIAKPVATASVVLKPLPYNEDPSYVGRLNTGVFPSLSALGAPQSPPAISLYVATLHSMEVADSLLKVGKVPRLLYPQLWNSARGTWRPRSAFAQEVAALRSVFGMPPAQPPYSPTAFHSTLNSIYTFTTFGEAENQRAVGQSVSASDTYVLSVEDANAITALKILTALHDTTIRQIRSRELSQTASIVAALKELYQRTEKHALRTMLAKNLVQAEQRLLLLQNPTYPVAVEVVDPPAIVSEPKRSMLTWLIAGVTAGGLLGAAIILIRWLSALQGMPNRLDTKCNGGADTTLHPG